MCDKKSMSFRGAERSGVRFGGRPQGGRHRRQAGCIMRVDAGGVATSRPWSSQGDCAGATETSVPGVAVALVVLHDGGRPVVGCNAVRFGGSYSIRDFRIPIEIYVLPFSGAFE